MKRHTTIEPERSTTGGGSAAGAESLDGYDFRLPGLTGNPDDPRLLDRILPEKHEEQYRRLNQKLEFGRYELPNPPRNSMELIRLACDLESDIQDITVRVEQDPKLSLMLIEAANAVSTGYKTPIKTVDDAIVRVGLNGLRSLVLMLSVRQTIFSCRSLSIYAKQIWRQMYSCGCLAREISLEAEFDPEIGFMYGLLHDIGKIAVLATLSSHLEEGEVLPGTLIARFFDRYHQDAGVQLARAWNLPPETIKLIGCHHDLERQPSLNRAAAMVSLAHRIDLALCLAWIGRVKDAVKGDEDLPEFRMIGLPYSTRAQVMRRCVSAFRQAHAEFNDQKDD